jgi:hypothetical protein
VIVTVWPAMSSVPVRAAAGFASIARPTEADAFALPPLATWIHAAWLAAVHAQPDNVSTATDTFAADADTDEVAGVTVNRHGAASCVTVIAVPLTSIVPLRDEGTPLASMR